MVLLAGTLMSPSRRRTSSSRILRAAQCGFPHQPNLRYLLQSSARRRSSVPSPCRPQSEAVSASASTGEAVAIDLERRVTEVKKGKGLGEGRDYAASGPCICIRQARPRELIRPPSASLRCAGDGPPALVAGPTDEILPDSAEAGHQS